MVDMHLRFQGQVAQERSLPCLPRAGDLIDAHAALWRVAAVVFAATVDVYVVQVADGPAADMRQEWAAWAETPAGPEPAAQRGCSDAKRLRQRPAVAILVPWSPSPRTPQDTTTCPRPTLEHLDGQRPATWAVLRGVTTRGVTTKGVDDR